MNDAAFQGTAELQNDLEQKLGAANARSLEQGLEQQQVRETLLPSFLQDQREGPDVNSELAKMQWLKEAAQEHVRWRGFCVPTDRESQVIASAMRALVRAWATENEAPRNLELLRGTGVPGSASNFEKEFLREAHKRSLWVMNLKNDAVLRARYDVLLQALPPIVREKVGGEQLET